MATRNYTSSSNNANLLTWSYGTALVFFTDRAVGAFSARDETSQVTGFANHDTGDAFTSGT